MKISATHILQNGWLLWAGRLLRRLGIALAILVLCLVVLEIVCIWLFPGRSTHYIVPGQTNGQDAWVDNQFFLYRFYPARLAPTPLPLTGLKETPEKSIRVCLLGDSMAMGSPSPAFGVGRQLELMLQTRYPDHHIEVLHMAMKGGNSHVLREVARDLKHLKPDVVVVLTGNDEWTGPYGPAAHLGKYQKSTRLVRLRVLGSRTRVAQLWRSASNRLFPARADVNAWKEQEPMLIRGRLPADAPQLRTAYRSFRKNMTAILEQARAAAPVVMVCTVPVNLRDSSPFITAYLKDERQAQVVRETMRAGVLAESNGRPEDAIQRYEEAIRLNPNHADALFRAAKLMLNTPRHGEALDLFIRARDADVLRLRVDSTLNKLIRECSTATGASLVDAAQLFAERSPDGIPGHEFFLDHVHLTFEGHYLLAATLLERMEALRSTHDEALHADIPPAERLAEELLFTPWGIIHQLDSIMAELAHYPFQRQMTQGETVQRLNALKSHWTDRLNALTKENTRAIFARQQHSRPQDGWLATRAAVYLIGAGDFQRAEQAALAALVQWPHRFDARAIVAWTRTMQVDIRRKGNALLKEQEAAQPETVQALAALKEQAEETQQILNDASRVEYNARANLNATWRRAEREWRSQFPEDMPDEELPERPEFDLPPSQVARRDETALALAVAKTNAAEADEAYQTALKSYERHRLATVEQLAAGYMQEDLSLILADNVDWGYFDIRAAIFIGHMLQKENRPIQSLPWLRYALARDPWNSEAAIALAESLSKLEDKEDSIKILEEALKRNNKNPLLWETLATLHCLYGDWRMATTYFREAEMLAPYRYERLLKWADALFRLKQYHRAERRINQYLTSVPYDVEALALKEQIQAAQAADAEPTDDGQTD